MDTSRPSTPDLSLPEAPGASQGPQTAPERRYQGKRATRWRVTYLDPEAGVWRRYGWDLPPGKLGKRAQIWPDGAGWTGPKPSAFKIARELMAKGYPTVLHRVW